MIVWCENCEIQQLDLYIDPAEPRAFHSGMDRPWCQPCLADNDKRSTLIDSRRSTLPYTAPYIGPNSLVSIEIDGQIYTDKYNNIGISRESIYPDPIGSLQSIVNEGLRKSFAKWDRREWEIIFYGPHHDIPNIIRSEN